MFLSIIIPAYNEGVRITKTLHHVKKYLAKQNFESEVIIVDDGSTDGFREKIEKMIAHWHGFYIYGYKKNQGKGAAVAYGMKKATGEHILFMDTDESTPIEQFDFFKPHLDKSAIIIGSRYLKKGYIKIKQPIWRILFARFSNFLIRLVLWLRFSDTQCGFKLFQKEAAKRIFSKMTLKRWGFDFEILFIAKKLGYKIREVPVFWYNEKRSKVKMRDFFATLLELFKVRINACKGKYTAV